MLRDFINNLNEQDRNFETIRENAGKIIELEHNLNKINFDKKHKNPHVYKINDYVMITNVDTTAGTNKKLIPKYRGPYVISKVLPNDRYVVEDIPGFQIT